MPENFSLFFKAYFQRARPHVGKEHDRIQSSSPVTESQEEGTFLTPTLTPLLPQATTLHRKGLFALILLPRASHVPFKNYLETCKKAKTESKKIDKYENQSLTWQVGVSKLGI